MMRAWKCNNSISHSPRDIIIVSHTRHKINLSINSFNCSRSSLDFTCTLAVLSYSSQKISLLWGSKRYPIIWFIMKHFFHLELTFSSIFSAFFSRLSSSHPCQKRMFSSEYSPFKNSAKYFCPAGMKKMKDCIFSPQRTKNLHRCFIRFSNERDHP